MFESVSSIFLWLIVLIFGEQALWGWRTGAYLKHKNFQLVVVRKAGNSREYYAVTIGYALTALVSLVIFLIKYGTTL